MQTKFQIKIPNKIPNATSCSWSGALNHWFLHQFIQNLLQTVESTKSTSAIAFKMPKNLKIDSKITKINLWITKLWPKQFELSKLHNSRLSILLLLFDIFEDHSKSNSLSLLWVQATTPLLLCWLGSKPKALWSNQSVLCDKSLRQIWIQLVVLCEKQKPTQHFWVAM